jgi:hypothetical protein
MIEINFSKAIALYIIVFLITILFFWLLGREQKNKELFLDQKFIWFCSVCTYTYINTKEDTISICPRCGSYNKKLLT